MVKLIEPYYRYSFGDIGDSNSSSGSGQMYITKLHNGQEATGYIAVKDQNFLKRYLSNIPAEVADCIDLAVAVYAADGFSRHSTHVGSRIYVELPVRCRDLWNAEAVYTSLQKLLNWFTGDDWIFSFKQRVAHPRLAERQYCIPFSDQPTEVSLWSGGLDAFAGLYNRILDDPSIKHTLFGTGGDFYIESVQKSVSNKFNGEKPGIIELIQVPLRFHRSSSNHLSKNSVQRTRGFVFILLGAVCAYLQGQDTLYVYENGVGAINLPFQSSEKRLNHSLSAHPLSLQRMSNFLSIVFNREFIVINPFLFCTKAEMCSTLQQGNLVELIKYTITCDHRRRESVKQCGCCSSCLLRRQALIAANIKDETRYAVLEEPSARKIQSLFSSNHLFEMKQQVADLRKILQSSEPWFNLVQQWGELEKIVEETSYLEGVVPISASDLLSLYRRYVEEWSNPCVLKALSRNLLDTSTHWRAA